MSHCWARAPLQGVGHSPPGLINGELGLHLASKLFRQAGFLTMFFAVKPSGI